MCLEALATWLLQTSTTKGTGVSSHPKILIRICPPGSPTDAFPFGKGCGSFPLDWPWSDLWITASIFQKIVFHVLHLAGKERMAAHWGTFFHGMPMVFARPYTSPWQPFLPNPGDPASFRISTMRFLVSLLTPLHSGTVLSGLIVDLWANREF